MKPPGEMTTHETGAKREDKTGKGRLDLISPIMLNRLAILMEEGGIVHGFRNWEKGMKLSGFLSSTFRHLIQTIDGCEDEDHPIQAIFNLMAYIHTLHLIRTGALPPELDDLLRYQNLLKIERSWKAKIPFVTRLSEPSIGSSGKNLTPSDDPTIKQHEGWCISCSKGLTNDQPFWCDKCMEQEK